MTRQKRALVTCCATHSLHDGLADVTYVLLPLLAQTFGLSLSQVGIIRAVHRVAMASFQIPAGLIAERFGERNLLALGTFVLGLAFLALGYVDGFWMILIALFFAGIGSAVQHPLSSTIISHAYPGNDRRLVLGTYNFFGDVGKFTFGGIVSLLVVAGISWQASIIGFGFASVITSVVVFLMIANTRAAGATAEGTAPARRMTGWGIRNVKGFTALCLIEIVDAATRAGFLTFIAFLLIAKDLPKDWAALSVPIILVGGMAGKLACGFLAERFGIIRMIAITELATGAGILATLALPGAASFLLLPLIGVVLNDTSSVLYGSIGDYVGHQHLSRVFGVFYTIGSVSGIAAPLGYGLMGDSYGIETSIAVIGFASFLTVPLALLLRPDGASRLRSA